MAWTEADLETIDEAIASGELRIRTSDGRMIEYRSISELRAAREMIRNEVNPPTLPGARRFKTRAGFSV